MKENINPRTQAPRTRKRTITKIEAVKKEPPRLKVCGYCRVSTVDQNSSIENQRQHFLDVISKHENWSFVDIYYEDGVTGTKKELRPELHRLIEDCKSKKINLILCKSISRFARNTTDFLELVRLLTGMGVDLYFEKEQIRGLPLLRLKQELEQVEDQKDQLEMAISTFAETGRLPENSSFHPFAVNDPNMVGDGNDDRDEVEDEDGVDNNEELIISQIKEKLDSLKQRHRELLSQKAEYDIQDMQIMTLLELIDDMTAADTPATSASTASATFDSEESQSREKERETSEKTEGETDNETTVDMNGEEIRKQEIPACYDIDDFFRRTNRHDHHGPITEFSDDDVIRYVDMITVFPEKMVVKFKADLEIEMAE